MPLTSHLSAAYADALVALATATHRPANVVNLGDAYAIRVEFELGRHLLATNDGTGLSVDDDSGDRWWTVRFFDEAGRVVAVAEREWLVDAFDAVLDELRMSDWWRERGTAFGELAADVP